MTIRLCLLVLLGMSLAGCGTPRNPVWLADSKSFVFTRNDGSVLQYDIERNASRTLVDAGVQRINQVAVSPDNKYLAVAQAASGPDAHAASITIRRLSDGTEIVTRMVKWGKQDGRRDFTPASCFWCPSGKRVLLCYKQPQKEGFRFAVYDVSAAKLRALTTSAPAVQFAAMLDVSPFCPDGSGYLAMPEGLGKGAPVFRFVDWDGWESAIAVSPESQKLLDQLDRKALDETPPVPFSRGTWFGKSLLFTCRLGEFRIDLDRKLLTVSRLSDVSRAEFEKLHAIETSEPGWLTWQVVPFQEGEFAVHCRIRKNVGDLRVELVKTATQARRMIAEGKMTPNGFDRVLTRSPDGRHILVALTQDKTHRAHVVSDDGRIVATVSAGRVTTQDN